MPTVQRYPIGGEVNRQPTPAVYLNNQLPINVRNSESLTRGFDSLSRELLSLQKEHDAEASLGATVKLENMQRDLLFHPQNGLTQLRGRDAVGRSKEALQQLDEAYKDTLSELENNDQRGAVRASYLEMRGRTQSALYKWEAENQRTAMIETLDARVKSALDDIATSPLDPANVASGVTRIEDATRAAVRLAGGTDEVLQRALSEGRSKAHETAIMRMVDLRPEWAEAYYKENRAEIEGTAQRGIEKALEEGGLAVRSQRAAGELWTKHGGNVRRAIAEARAGLSGAVEDETVRRLKTLYDERRTLISQGRTDATHSRKELVRQAFAWLDTHPGKVTADMPAELRDELNAAGTMGTVRAYEANNVALRSQLESTELLEKHDGDVDAAVRDAMVSMSGALEDETVRRLQQLNDDKRSLATQNREDVLRNAFSWLDQNPTLTPDDMPSSMRSEIVSNGSMGAVRQAYAQKNSPTVNMARVWEIQRLRVSDPEAFMKLDLSRELPTLGTHGIALIDEQRTWRLHGVPWDAKNEMAETNDWLNANKNIVRGYGLEFGEKASKGQLEKFNMLDARMLKNLHEYQKQHSGEQPPSDVVRDWLLKEIRDVYPLTSQGRTVLGVELGAGRRPAYEVADDAEYTLPGAKRPVNTVRTTGEIPPAEFSVIAKYVDAVNNQRHANGLPPMDRNALIKSLYSRVLAGENMNFELPQ